MNRRIVFLSFVVGVIIVALLLINREPEQTGRTQMRPTDADVSPEVPMEVVGGGAPSILTDDVLSGALRRVPDVDGFSPAARYTPDPHDHVKQAWQGRLRPSLQELANSGHPQRGEGFTVPLFDGEEITIAVHQFTQVGEGSGVYTGEVVGEPGSFVTLAYVGAAEAGSIHLPARDQVFEIRAGPEQTIIVSEVDVHALGECGLHHENVID